MTHTPLFLFVFSLLAMSPSLVQAEVNTIDRYADSIISSDYTFYSPEKMLGAPDNIYADNTSGGASIRIDMGEGEEGLGNLTFFYAVWSAQVQISISLLDAQGNVLTSQGGYAPLANTWVIPYTGTTPYRYVGIRNLGTAVLRIDAMETERLASAATEESSPAEPEEVITPDPARGNIVKLADDRDQNTTTDSIVYLLDAKNRRHIVPNETVYASWNFPKDKLTYIGTGTLTGMPLGANVPMRPGSSLIKITASPKVYAIDAEGKLRWIQAEEIAAKLYGAKWNKHIVDIPETLFVAYKHGADIASAVYPSGTFIKDKIGSIWYINAEGKRLSVSQKITEALELSPLPTGLSLPDLMQGYPSSGKLSYSDDLRWPF